MSIQAEVAQYIDNVGPGKVFGYDDMPAYRQSPNAVVKAVSRLIKSNKIKRLSKGNFYRPKLGLLGEVRPSSSEVLKSVLFRGSQRVGYVTGPSLYNRLGLTTQIPKTVTIAINGARQAKDLKAVQIKLKVAKAPITENIIPQLELLDALNDIKKVADTRPDSVLHAIDSKASKLSDTEFEKMVQLALQYYPASVRALLGLICDGLQRSSYASQLQLSLNPLSTYKIGLQSAFAKKWNIR